MAFGDSGIKKIELPISLLNIGTNAFYGSALTDIYVPGVKETEVPSGWAEDWNGGCKATVHWNTPMP